MNRCGEMAIFNLLGGGRLPSWICLQFCLGPLTNSMGGLYRYAQFV